VTTRAREIRRLTSLATPVVITQVGMMTMGMVDVIMIGHVGVEELAAASLGRDAGSVALGGSSGLQGSASLKADVGAVGALKGRIEFDGG
jgi:Na+-driven multidrug efflux pump